MNLKNGDDHSSVNPALERRQISDLCKEERWDRQLAMSNNSKIGNRSYDSDECLEAIEQALQDMAREGLIVDSGRREWNELTGRYDIVCASIDAGGMDE